jgi:hypothetical protein
MQSKSSKQDYLKGLKDGLGAEATKRMIVGEIPYKPTDPMRPWFAASRSRRPLQSNLNKPEPAAKSP